MLSIVVNFYNNQREAANTLYSLSRAYQSNAQQIDFEVIAIDNGSARPLSAEFVCSFGPEFRYRYVDTSSPSPASALNAACRDARGTELLVIIDGAHILTPGVYGLALEAFAAFRSPFIAMAALHLGPKQQNVSMREGYNQTVEDKLLSGCGWKQNGYRLYDIAGSFADPGNGWFGNADEAGCFGLRREDFLAIGGFDEHFVTPGGGLVNLDLFQRAVAHQDWQYLMLLGEGSFHQFHGGVATNATLEEHPWDRFHEEYVRVRGKPYTRVERRPYFFGPVPNEALASVRNSIQLRLEFLSSQQRSI
jgi:hypothetical protein